MDKKNVIEEVLVVDEEIKETETVEEEVAPIEDDKDKKEENADSEIVEEEIDVEALIKENEDLKAQLEKIQAQQVVEEKSEKELELEQRELKLWNKEVSIVLKENGLDAFIDFIKVGVGEDKALLEQVGKLKEIVGDIEMKNSYKPTDNKAVDEYSIARKNRDVKSMIGSKIK